MPMFGLLFAFLYLLCAAVPGWAAFSVPERLVFEISWGGITAGTAVQEVKRSDDGIIITSTAHSADWLSLLYKVDDRIEAVMGKGEEGRLFGAPRIYRENIKEGRSRFHKEVTFDYVGRSAQIVNFLDKSTNSLEITPITFDSLSCFYFVRMQPLEPGTSFYIDIFDGKKLHKTEVKVLRREELETIVGTFKSIVIMPVLQTEGIFSKTGDLTIWLSDDERRIPLKMQSKIRIGSITASLVGGSYWADSLDPNRERSRCIYIQSNAGFDSSQCNNCHKYK
jgi:hypothetical protein